MLKVNMEKERPLSTKNSNQNEERYRALADASFEAVFISEMGVCIEANLTACHMFGYDYDELIGLYGTDVIAPQSKALVKRYMLSGFDQPYQAVGLKKDGTTFHIQIRGRMMTYRGKQARVTVVQDIDNFIHTDRALAESETRFRTLVECAPIGFSIMGKDQKFEYFNPKFTEIFGYSILDLPDKESWFQKAYPDPQYRASTRAIWEHDSRFDDQAGELAKRTFKVRAKNGRDKIIRFSNVSLTHGKQLLTYEDITARMEVLKMLKVRERQLTESEHQLRRLTSNLLTTQEKERRRIAYALHDELGQDLSVLNFQLIGLESKLNSDPQDAINAYRDIRRQVGAIVENVRRLSRGLSPTTLENLGLTAALSWLLKELSKYTAIKITKEIDAIDNLFPSESEIIIYRIFQESLANIRKHARASRVSVRIKRHPNYVFFLLKDNGQGFDMHTVESQEISARGLGLTAMAERARILGGPLKRTSFVGRGTRIKFTVPLQGKESS